LKELRRKQDLLKNEEEPERDNSEQNVPEALRGGKGKIRVAALS
jgi:hypothetical protein